MMMMISMEMVYPRFHMDVVDLKINLMHQIMPCYVYVKYFLKNVHVIIIFTNLNSIFKIIMLVVMNVKMCQTIV
jgi:hypothetical protein